MKRNVFAILLASMLLITACGNTQSDSTEVSSSQESIDDAINTTASEEVPIPTHKLYYDVNVSVSDEMIQEHTIEMFLDEELAHSFDSNEYYTELVDVEEGEHSVSFKLDDQIISDLNQVIEVKEDTTVAIVMGFSDTLEITSFDTVASIADSAIKYDDMIDEPLDKALEELGNKHFVNVKYESNDDSSILDSADWVVVNQNVTPEAELDKATEIVLTCRKVYHQLYIDLTFDQNLFLATYDIEIYLDGSKIDTIPHGQSFTYMTKLKEGAHSVTFYKSTDNSVYSEKKIDVTTDSTLTGRLHSNNKDIELNDFVLKNEIANTSFEVVSISGMRLDKALELLGNIGFTNVQKEPYGDIWVDYNWIVTSQSVNAGETVDKNTKIVLNCVKKEQFLSTNYLRLNILEAEQKANEFNNAIQYIDYAQNMYMTNKVSSMNDDEKKLWIVKQASYSDDDKINLYFVYTGKVEMPDVVSSNLKDALETLKKAGFSSIDTKTDNDGYIWDNSDWEVVSQSVQAGETVNANNTVTLTVTNINQTTTQSTSSSNNTTTENTTTEEKEEVVLTKDNCEELAELLSAPVVDPDKQAEFVMKHTGDIIEFDAIVMDLQQKPNTKTYYSYTLIPGEDIEHVGAALFYIDYIQWRNFNWENSPGELTITSKIKIRAEIVGGSSYIQIKPVKTWGRK